MSAERGYKFRREEFGGEDDDLAIKKLKFRIDKNMTKENILLDQDGVSYRVLNVGGYGPNRGLGSRLESLDEAKQFSGDIYPDGIYFSSENSKKEEPGGIRVRRVGHDGSEEYESFQKLDMESLLRNQPDPFEGSRIVYEERFGIDGVEMVPVKIIPPFDMGGRK